MKKIMLLLSMFLTVAYSNAQTPDEQKFIASIQHIPSFHILSSDSTFFTPANLKKGKPVMIIYFSPDCSHCQHMMYELKPKMNELKNIQVVMVTFSKDYDIRGIREFKRDFGLKDYPNFTLGTEGYTMFVQNYYKIKTTPFVAIYDSKGNLSKYYDKAPTTSQLIASVKKV